MHAHRFSWALALLVILGGIAGDVEAKDDEAREPSELELTTTRAVVFKDGYALFVRRGRAKADAQARVFTTEVPDAAVLGCFWALSQDEQALGMKARLVTTTDTTVSEAPCVSILDLLRANTGRVLTLHYGDGTEYRGALLKVLERDPHTPSAAPLHAGYQPRHGAGQPSQPMESEREVVKEGGSYVLLQLEADREVILPAAPITSLSGSKLVTTVERTFERTAVEKQLEFQLSAEKAGKDVEVQILYFAPSLRWIPTYRLAGDLVKDADLALQGEILNEAEDLQDVALDLVVGVPNFRFKQVVSPLVLEAQLRNALHQAAPQLMGQARFSNAMFQSRAGERRGPDDPAPAELAPELAAGGSQDMFVYSVPKFSIERGARATVPLWQNRVPLRHLYTLDISLGRDPRAGRSYQRKRGSHEQVAPMDLAQHDVWHQLELENKSQVPWTTGAALTMQGNVPIAQELLTYTPIQAKTLLPLTIAVDVRADYDEEEVERHPNAIQYNRNAYAQVRKKGVLRLTNFRPEPTTLRITVAMGGKGLEVSDGGTLRINDYRAEDWSGDHDARLNNHTDVEWNLTLQPGETRALTCDYEFYIR